LNTNRWPSTDAQARKETETGFGRDGTGKRVREKVKGREIVEVKGGSRMGKARRMEGDKDLNTLYLSHLLNMRMRQIVFFCHYRYGIVDGEVKDNLWTTIYLRWHKY
jgi:hypothetical protein